MSTRTRWFIALIPLAAMTLSAAAPAQDKEGGGKRKVAKPKVIKIPSPNKTDGRGGAKIDTIVLHHTAGTGSAEDVGRQFQDPKAEVSSHYIVGKKGTIVQCVDDQDRAFHAGESAFKGRKDVNDFSIGIEIVNKGDGKDPFTDQQYDALGRLVAYLQGEHGIPRDRITGHKDVALPKGRKNDPADNFSYKRLDQAIAEARGGQEKPDKKPEKPDKPAGEAGSGVTPNLVLSKLKPTGASKVTASQDGLKPGVDASHQMAKTDADRVLKHRDKFEQAGRKFDLPPALLAAIASRESRGGSALDKNGWGDRGNGFGIMQVDKNFHKIEGGKDPASLAHIMQATGILNDYVQQVKKKHPKWPPERQLQGAVVAYNSGVGNVQSIDGMDKGTTGDDYSNDVWARAQWYARNWDKK